MGTGSESTMQATSRSNDELERELITLSAHLAAGMARFIELVGELDATAAYEESECRSAAHFLNWKCGVNERTARDYVRVAGALRKLPQVRAAFAAGEISYCKVRSITRVANADNEETLVMWARHATTAMLDRIVAKFAQVSADDAVAIQVSRFVALDHDDSGAGVGRLRLAPEELALLQKAIEAFRTELRSGSREPGDKSPNNADALMAIVETAMAHGPTALRGSDKYTVLVHLDAQTGHATVEGRAVHPEAGRRLSCDATLVRLRTGPGEQLDLGRRTRTPSPAQHRALQVRDGGCRFPGCDQRRFVQAHHVLHWADGGSTDLDNLLLLCWGHHHAVHEGGYAVTREDGAFVFFRPDGTELPAETPQMRADGPGITEQNRQLGLDIDLETADCQWDGSRCDYGMAVDALVQLDGEHRRKEAGAA